MEPPARYLYLVDLECEELLAIYSCDHLAREIEVNSYEARLRTKHAVDDVESGLALRDSALQPLPDELLRKAWLAR